jgi:uncharacterized protein YndB with AHSA1/START domain
MAKTMSVSMSVTLPASPKDVFDALTNPKIIASWCGQKGKVEAEIGGKFEMFDGWVMGKVLAFESGKRLSYTWLPDEWKDKWNASIVSFTFSKAKSGTKVILKHSGFPNEDELKSHHEGWKEHVFDPLKKHFKK